MRISIKRHLIHWMAIAAILMGALAPSISQAIALSEQGKGISVEVCTTTGSKMTQIISTVVQMINKWLMSTAHFVWSMVPTTYLLITR